ncbi:MAG: hypothetical protein AAGJ53_09850 [Pseudomonadota bacterium]
MAGPSPHYDAASSALAAAHRERQRREAALDEQLLLLRDALRMQRLADFELSFARSLMRQSRRKGWTPTPKQQRLMQSIIDGLRAEARPLVDYDDDGGADAA